MDIRHNTSLKNVTNVAEAHFVRNICTGEIILVINLEIFG